MSHKVLGSSVLEWMRVMALFLYDRLDAKRLVIGHFTILSK